jgi:hypothetical protein
MRDSEVEAFADYLNRVDSRDLENLRLGKKSDALLAEADKLQRQLERYGVSGQRAPGRGGRRPRRR